MEGIIKTGVWRKGNLVCDVEFEKFGILSLNLSPEQLAEMGCGYSEFEVKESFNVCNLWINHCEKGQNAGMIRQYDLDVIRFRKAKNVLNEIKNKKLTIRLEFV